MSSFGDAKSLRNNWSKLFLFMVLLTIFSIQPISSSELTFRNNSDAKNTTNFSSNTNSVNKISSQLALNAVNSSNSLRNISMSDLFNYLKSAYQYVPNSFADSSYDYLATTVTIARALAILKMVGLTNYIVPTSSVSQLFNSFILNKNGGYSIESSVTSLSSIMGTFGVLESVSFYNQSVPNPQKVSTYLKSNFHVFENMSGFKEASETNINASIRSTYYAIESLQLLNTLQGTMNSTEVNQTVRFLQSLWNSTGNYINNQKDPDQSVFLTTFEAISILNIFTKNHYTIDQTLYSEIKSGFPLFVKANQDKVGKFIGAIHSSDNIANVDDTGISLSSLYILNNLTSINTSAAIHFILNSQYNGTTFKSDVGGFSSNNATSSESNLYSDVTLTHTYYAILGLYSSGFLSNYTSFSFETEFSKTQHVNSKLNEILIEQNTNLTATINTLNFKDYSGAANIKIKIDGLDVSYIGFNNSNSVSGSEYSFSITNATSLDFHLGSHNLTAYYSLSNFSIVPVITKIFNSSIIVRLPIINTINGVSTNIQVSPGDTLNGIIHFDNILVNGTTIKNSVLGNVSVSLIDPNNLTDSHYTGTLVALNISLSNYNYNYTLPSNITLGDYLINISYSNSNISPKSIFYTEQIINVRTNIILLSIGSLNNAKTIYPGSSYGLNFNLSYENGFMNPNVTSIKARFLEFKSQKEKFNVSLVYAGSNIFSPASSSKVPIDLLMGSYSVSIELTWNSSTTNSTLVKTATNSTLPLIIYSGTPIILNDQITPVSNRTEGNILYSGDYINFTAQIGLKNKLTSQIFPLNSSNLITATFYNTSKPTQVLQELGTKNLNNSLICAYGEVNPLINQLSDINLTLIIRVQFISTGTFNLTSRSNNNDYRPTFLLKKAKISLDQSSVNFVIGSPSFEQNSFTTLLVTFKIISGDNSQYVTGLKLNATMGLSKSDSSNQSEIVLPSITSLDQNKSYQIQIPVNNLNTGTYIINISTLNTNQPLGSFNVTILPIVNNNQIPIENFLAVGAVGLALVVTMIANSINKRKK